MFYLILFVASVSILGHGPEEFDDYMIWMQMVLSLWALLKALSSGAVEMAQQFKTLTALTDNLGVILSTHMVACSHP